MQSRIPFSAVASLAEILPDGSNLFPNIAIAQGETMAEQHADALHKLMDMPGIDAVVIFDDKREAFLPLDAFRRLSVDKRIKIDSDPSFILAHPGWAQQEMRRTLADRYLNYELQGTGAFRFNQRDLVTVSDYYCEMAGEVGHALPARIVNSSLRYYPNYGSIHTLDGQINTHIDNKQGFDARLIHVTMGSGTVLFDNRDFAVDKRCKNGVDVFSPRLLHEGISVLILPEGASVLITAPSPAMLALGKPPNIHAHGIGRDNGEPEERLVERHDLALF
ncbi:MAG: hypothetical protein H6858_01560 [Rhodospirillales bacterium]|nr:hypothetical protein [Alphaproteobacteria bacterium]MCB1841254.1 hypothetical protein [Alphaproteobacteria bacterium]MCB9976269.1 hypothetical protein [Rhodospirillales bacterium]